MNLPLEILLHTTTFVNDKQTLLSLRLVCKLLRNKLTTIEYVNTDNYKIVFNPEKILFYRNNSLYKDIKFNMGGFKSTEYGLMNTIKTIIQSDNFKIKKYTYHTGSTELKIYDSVTEEKTENTVYYNMCTIS